MSHLLRWDGANEAGEDDDPLATNSQDIDGGDEDTTGRNPMPEIICEWLCMEFNFNDSSLSPTARALRIPRLPPPSHMASHDAIAPPILAVVGFKSDPKREDRIISYKGKEKDLSKVLIPQEIRVLRREKAFNRIMPINFRSKRGDVDAKLTHPKMQDKRKFGKVLLSFRQQGLIDSDSFYEGSEEEIKNLKEAMQELKTMDISEESILSLENVKRLIQRNFSENPLTWWDRNKIEATLKIKEECKYEYVRYKPIQMNIEDKRDMQVIIKAHINLDSSSLESLHTVALDFCREHLIDCIKGAKVFSKFDCKSGFYQIKMESESKEFIAFSTPQGIELQEHIVEKIRNFPDILKDKKQLQSFLGVVNFAGIFIKDLAKYRKDFRPLLKETDSAKWKWEEIHTQRVRELKQVCNNLPKLAIPQDEDELVVYTDANDYRWAAVLMKRTTTGEEPCRYTRGLFNEQQARVWHINEKEFFAIWKAFKKWPLFLLAKEFTLKIDNTNVKLS
ncbi:UNVERIFIED_CONTAM: Enzymatic polyprotein [Sesamum calycinum]|uniref:Enzymatic polyprotein n=1 Tax=Sesamum calycinum TaxID=2727403 RepID=A0AAW2KM36_9LAMI